MSEPESSDNLDHTQLVGLPRRVESHARLPLETIASNFLDQVRSGQPVDMESFIKNHPDMEDELREFLPLILAMEGWKTEKENQVVRHPLPDEFDISHLGNCKIIREVGRGGMGVVFEAEQAPINRRVAVKLLPWKFKQETEWSQQFHREARTAAQLQHPNIVSVFSFGEEDGRLYYVMPLIEGVGLDKLISYWKDIDSTVDVEDLITTVHGTEFGHENRGTNPQPGHQRKLLKRDNWAQIVKLAVQIVNAIRYAHRQGTLHRDIKPGNLLIDRSGTVWVADFGLALGRERFLDDQFFPLAGTLRYMAPEQFDGITNELTDIYSFGATLYELCTLQPAFDSTSKSEMIRQITTSNPATPRSINPNIPTRLEAVIRKCLDRNPSKRYLTANELYGELLKLVSELSNEPKGLWRQIRGWF
ncbi:Serine/threonine-protein kinase PrkC [Thalassoglobus neptunius]|uniref:Serine/threonine-protein kinase PrkC n=1 Tax=Thalassoglobus neptunius TaxID=1938619 RepID=A0A5C5W855_9PLAN|nr:serine/threonine-protein kinase [Thalassoglobus neptunius]TWT47078.1 Serine/threonine-protein kinase PrkC [Thalassoglobus neptunius]